MKKVININFQGRVVPIEETAFELLKQYTDSLRNYFANEEGRDEIINDIESRIAELFEERLKSGVTCITDDDVNVIINNMGRPQDFADADDMNNGEPVRERTTRQEYQQTAFASDKKLYRDKNNSVLGGVCAGIAAYFNIEPIIVRILFFFSGIGFFAYLVLWAILPASDNVFNGVKKRLYRNPDSKTIAGVCSGIATYFNINVWIPRLIFLLPFVSIFFRWGHFGPFNFPHFLSFSFSPSTFIIYIILWIVLPEATTTAEKLEMKGEKVDMNSIKNSVLEEMKGVKERVGKLGQEGKEFASRVGSAGTEMGQATRKAGRSFGDIIVFCVKMLGYFIIGCVGFAVIVGAFALGVVALGLFPLKNYMLNAGWENVFAWGALLFFVGIPVVGIITWIVRRIAKVKRKNNLLRYSFLALWILGLVCFIGLIVSVSQDFRNKNTLIDENVALVNPQVGRLTIEPTVATKYYGQQGWLKFEPFANIDEDTAFLANVTLRIVQSKNDSFQVTLLKRCNGSSRRWADTLAAHINFNVQQVDSTLYLDRGIAITPAEKFRNQHVVVTLHVPVGKVIRINRNTMSDYWEHFNGPWNDNDWNYSWDNQEINGWENHYDEDLIMKSDGLYTMDGKPAKEGDRSGNRRHRIHITPGNVDITTDERDDNDGDDTEIIIDSNIRVKSNQHQLKIQQKTDKLKDSLEKIKQQIDKKIQKLDENANKIQAMEMDMTRTFMLDI